MMVSFICGLFIYFSVFGSRQDERKSDNSYEQDVKTPTIYCCYLKHTQLYERWRVSAALLKQMKSLWLSNRTGFVSKEHKRG